jgi:predicted dehydrogenase
VKNTTSNSPIPVAVIGTGRMGRLHAKTFAAMPQVKLVGVFDANRQAAEKVAAEFNTTAFDRLTDLLPLVRAATIATPTQFHAEAAGQCLERKVACLIEKPLARNAVECQELVQRAKQTGVVVQVGHSERFNPAVQALLKLNLSPRFIETLRVSPMTFRSLDVSVVLDMMIHDLDVVLKLIGSPLKTVAASGVGVIGDSVDVCNARLDFANGAAANVMVSRLAMKTERKLRLFSPDAFVSLDYGNRTGMIARKDSNLAPLRQTAAKVQSGEITDLSQLNFRDMVKWEPLAIEPGDPLTMQAQSFIEAVIQQKSPQVTVEDGLAAVEAAERIVAAINDPPLQ